VSDWVAVSAMVLKNSIATVMDELTAEGATDILVLKIENSRTDYEMPLEKRLSFVNSSS
jgi:ATP phosphoribosyltransferase